MIAKFIFQKTLAPRTKLSFGATHRIFTHTIAQMTEPHGLLRLGFAMGKNHQCMYTEGRPQKRLKTRAFDPKLRGSQTRSQDDKDLLKITDALARNSGRFGIIFRRQYAGQDTCIDLRKAARAAQETTNV
jgi:hypothetical protein